MTLSKAEHYKTAHSGSAAQQNDTMYTIFHLPHNNNTVQDDSVLSILTVMHSNAH